MASINPSQPVYDIQRAVEEIAGKEILRLFAASHQELTEVKRYIRHSRRDGRTEEERAAAVRRYDRISRDNHAPLVPMHMRVMEIRQQEREVAKVTASSQNRRSTRANRQGGVA